MLVAYKQHEVAKKKKALCGFSNDFPPPCWLSTLRLNTHTSISHLALRDGKRSLMVYI